MPQAGTRDDGLFKADPLGLPQPLFQAGDAAHFPAQAHLADGDQLVADGLVQQRGDHAHTDGQVTGSVPQGNAAYDVDIDVQVAEEIPGPPFQNSQQQIDPVVIVAGAGPPGRREGGLGGQGLDLAEDGACAFHGAGHAVARDAEGPAFQQHLGGVGDLSQAAAGHIEHSQLVGGAIAVFGRAQDAVRQHLVPLKIEDGVHNVLHDLGAGNGAVLIHVPHQEHGDLLLFGHRQQTGGALLHLADRAGGRRNVRTAHGLDRVDDHEVWLFLLNQAADLVHIVFGGKVDVVLGQIETGSPQLDLPHRLLAGDIEDGVPVRDGPAQLQQHSGLAHARLAAEQHDAAQHDAAAQHAVQLGNAGDDPALFLGGADVCQPPGCQAGDAFLAGRCLGRRAAGFGRLGHHILVHGIPAAAAGAAAHPAGARLPAVGADIDGFQFGFFHTRHIWAPLFVSLKVILGL